MDKKKLVAVIGLLVLTVLFLAKSLFADNEDHLNTPIAYDNTESSYETIEYIVDLDSSDLEQEAYTEEQIFFENAEVLYDYISFIDFEDVKVFFGYAAHLEHGVAEPLHKGCPVAFSVQDYGEVGYLLGLHESERFEQFVDSPVAAGENHETHGVFHEHHLFHV